MNLDNEKIAIIGLGYVGLPLAVAFGRSRPVVGFDVSSERIDELKRGLDSTFEIDSSELTSTDGLTLTDDPAPLRECGIFIITVPTPIDRSNRPDLSALKRATETVGWAMSNGAVVIYESTVYPGCTRNVCVPILEKFSGMHLNQEFFVGYSPERANPGDRDHRLATVVKVTSGSTPDAAEAIDHLYGQIVPAGTHRTSSIEVAESAKVIENTQRDLNIALMNELAIIFNRMGIDTTEVLQAAQTKWNFLQFTPGLVGGHCVGVDPYYLTHRAQELGYHPDVILAGRRINDGMGVYVASQVARLMMTRGLPVVGSRILLMGIAFKENCPDTRNSKAIDVAVELKQLNAVVDIWDPVVSPRSRQLRSGLLCFADEPQKQSYDAVVVTVGHREFVAMGAEGVKAFGKPGAILFDVKSIFARSESDGRL